MSIPPGRNRQMSVALEGRRPFTQKAGLESP